jgi:hypothetical protein
VQNFRTTLVFKRCSISHWATILEHQRVRPSCCWRSQLLAKPHCREEKQAGGYDAELAMHELQQAHTPDPMIER